MAGGQDRRRSLVEVRGDLHAYPMRVMLFHEIVNDEIAGVPVALTYCPLCNSTVAFRREVGPFARPRDEAPVNDRVRGRPLVVLFDPLVASALDTARIPDGREVGSAAVFSRIARRRALKFEPGPDPGTVRDTQTDSTWDMSGRATAGPLAGTRLQRVPYHDQFWFALAAFFDDAEIRR